MAISYGKNGTERKLNVICIKFHENKQKFLLEKMIFFLKTRLNRIKACLFSYILGQRKCIFFCLYFGTEGVYVLCAAVGCDNTETASHLFLQCDTSRELWNNVFNWLGISLVMSLHLRHHFMQFTKMAGWLKSSHLFFTIIWFATV